MTSSITSRRIIALVMALVMSLSLLLGLHVDAEAANTSYYPIITNSYQLTGSTQKFTITGNRFTHKKVTIEGVFQFSAAGNYTKAVTNWWAKNLRFYVWVYDKNGNLYDFKNGVKSGTKISLPMGKNNYSVYVYPSISKGWDTFYTACNGYVASTWSFAQYRLKGV